MITIQQIKEAINNGKRVFWHHRGYEVIKDSIGQFLIHCNMNDTYIGLHGMKGTEYENKANLTLKDVYLMPTFEAFYKDYKDNKYNLDEKNLRYIYEKCLDDKIDIDREGQMESLFQYFQEKFNK